MGAWPRQGEFAKRGNDGKAIDHMEECPQCKTKLLIKKNKTKDGSIGHELYCHQCLKDFGLVQMDNDPSEFVMPFGKWKGYTLKEVVVRDRTYLEWAAHSFASSNVKSRILKILEINP